MNDKIQTQRELEFLCIIVFENAKISVFKFLYPFQNFSLTISSNSLTFHDFPWPFLNSLTFQVSLTWYTPGNYRNGRRRSGFLAGKGNFPSQRTARAGITISWADFLSRVDAIRHKSSFCPRIMLGLLAFRVVADWKLNLLTCVELASFEFVCDVFVFRSLVC